MKYLQSQLTEKGWKVSLNDQHFDIDFDLVGFRRFTITKWNVLVKTIDVFDTNTLNEWKENFKILNKKSKSYLHGRCFVLCLIINETSSDIKENITSLSDSFGLFGTVRVQGGGGTILIANRETKEVLGKVPKLPLDVRKYNKLMKELLQNFLTQMVDVDKENSNNWKEYSGGWGVYVDGGDETDHISLTKKDSKVGEGFHITVNNKVRIYFDKEGKHLGEGMGTSKLLTKLNDLRKRGVITEGEHENSLSKLSELKKS